MPTSKSLPTLTVYAKAHIETNDDALNHILTLIKYFNINDISEITIQDNNNSSYKLASEDIAKGKYNIEKQLKNIFLNNSITFCDITTKGITNNGKPGTLQIHFDMTKPTSQSISFSSNNDEYTKEELQALIDETIRRC